MEKRDFVILQHLMLEAIVTGLDNLSGKFSRYDLDFSSKSLILNKKSYSWDLQLIGPSSFHIIKDHKSFSARILEIGPDSRTLVVMINNSRYRVVLRTRLDLLLQDMGFRQEDGTKLDQLRAPMPGLILDVMVNQGAEVKKGDSLLILEAMKMENVIKAPGDGEIKEMKVFKGDRVEKNQIMIQF